MKQILSIVLVGCSFGVGTLLADGPATRPAPATQPAGTQPAAPAKGAANVPANAPAAQGPAAGPAAAKPAAVVVNGVVAKRVGMGFNAKAQRDAQKQSIKNMADGGSFKMSDIVRFSIADGRIKAEWTGKFPSGQPKRIKIEGSDATWMVSQFSQGVNSFYTMVRYDFDAADDELWMTNFSFQQAQNVLSISAQGGDTCEIMRMFYSQQPNHVIVNVTGWDQGRAKQIVSANAPDLTQLRSDHPDEVRKFLAPVLRKLTGQPLLRPGASDMYRVFAQIPADPKITSRIEALLPDLISPMPTDRERAAATLHALGIPGALAALRFDPDLLLPEQFNRLSDLIAAHSRMLIDDPAALMKDVEFLLDCAEDDDLTIRQTAIAALEKLLGRKTDIDPTAPAAKRTAAIDALRVKLAKERKANAPKDAAAAPANGQNANGPVAVPLQQIAPAGGGAAGGGAVLRIR